MKEVFSSKNLDEDLVTKGFLRSEFKRELADFEVRFEKKTDTKFKKFTDIILNELQNMRAENREIYQMREQLYQNDLIQEAKIDALDECVLKLETVIR